MFSRIHTQRLCPKVLLGSYLSHGDRAAPKCGLKIDFFGVEQIVPEAFCIKTTKLTTETSASQIHLAPQYGHFDASITSSRFRACFPTVRMTPPTLTGNLKEESAGALTEGQDKDDQLRLNHSMNLYPWCHSSCLDLRSAQDLSGPFGLLWTVKSRALTSSI